MKDIISTEWLFDGKCLRREVSVKRDAEGHILEISEGIIEGAKYINGIVSPPFVNAHCHLELSYLKGHLPERTGMAGFIEALQSIRRDFSEGDRQTAIDAALRAMESNGITGLGDICNDASTAVSKRKSPHLDIRNFCEVFSLDPRQAQPAFERALSLARQFPRPAHPTLHAPYSISPVLRDLVIRHAAAREVPLSIHLLESTEERLLFEQLDGPMFELFHHKWGLPFSPHTHASPIDYLLEKLPRHLKVLLVHGVDLKAEEIERITGEFTEAYFVLCPRANAFIHDRLPDGHAFAKIPDRICLGTDSLAGTWSLDLLEDMKLMQENFDLKTEMLLTWATLNGAKALDFPLGKYRIQPGDQPRLLQITEIDAENAKLTASSRVQWL